MSQQDDATAVLEWGMSGLQELAPTARVTVIVDVLSFSTAVTVVVERSGAVIPWPYRDTSAAEEAARRGAYLAVRREAADAETPYSLSPASLRTFPIHETIVMPSQNGAELSLEAAQQTGTVLAGCLRNADATAHAAIAAAGDGLILVIAAGELRSGGGFRPALEDWSGAGAILDALRALGISLSIEAEVAADSYQQLRPLDEVIRRSTSGQELLLRGCGDDVTVASAVNSTDRVPVLGSDGVFRDRSASAAPPSE